MPARPRGRGFRGGGRGNFGGHWRGHRGGGGYHSGGRGIGHRGHGGRHDHYHGNREMHNPHQQRDPEKLLSSLGPEAQLALTTAIINSVLKTDGREGRSNYREREYHSRHRGSHYEGRGGYFREESRERRHFGEDRRSHEPRLYHEEGRGHHYEREKPTPGSPRYRNNRYSAMPRRRPSPHGHAGPSRKRQRMERMDSMEGDSSPHHDRDYEGERKSELDRERVRERKCRSPGQDRDHSGSEGDGEKNEEKRTGSDDPGGVQVTIRADGERAVNNEGRGRPRVAGRLFVELRCPHCPNQRSITFKEYKYHLGSEEHKSQLNRLARKHSVVLRKIRVQQRKEQRDIEVKWKEEKGEEFKNSVTRFCNTCKLVFKCLGGNTGEGISLHNSSKLHRMQKCYLHPRCAICRITFPSRMVYEYHIASISHLRVRTATMDKQGGSHRSDDQEQEEEEDDLDLADFMTLDSVGEDDEVGSEHEEITGGLDEAEVAKEAEGRRKQSLGRRYRNVDMLDDDEISVDADWDKDQLEDEDMEENEAVGTEYVNRIEAYFCSICSKIIRADTSIGSRAVQRHCRSYDHLNHYQDSHPPIDDDMVSNDENDEDVVEDEEENLEKKGDKDKVKARKEDETEGEMEEDAEREKLWEEVDKGLDMLQDEIMTEIEEKESLKTKKNDKEFEAVEARSSKEIVDESILEEVGEEEEDEEEEEEVEEEATVEVAAECADGNRASLSCRDKHHKPSAELLEEIADDSEEDT